MQGRCAVRDCRRLRITDDAGCDRPSNHDRNAGDPGHASSGIFRAGRVVPGQAGRPERGTGIRMVRPSLIGWDGPWMSASSTSTLATSAASADYFLEVNYAC